ncbi:MAG: hypothetical protein LBC85_12010 [Fibromonadaceae bacterium]|jgi:hypothetical protein|nr:hypothetical protein [Fibromonadaceae bacterium]
MQEQMKRVLEQAARLQKLVPDAILVGGSVASVYAGHRYSLDHDHVVSDLESKFDLILEALEREGDWVTNRLVYGKIILGELGGIEAGIRQLIRKKPLEFEKVKIDELLLNLPTIEEILRVKAFLIVKRNQMRDYLDFAALSDKIGIDACVKVINSIDDYYTDETRNDKPVLSQLVRQLIETNPKDKSNIKLLPSYKGTLEKWKDWNSTVDVCKKVAMKIMGNVNA